MTAMIIERLRAEFDGGFALPPHSVENDVEAFLAIRVGDRPYAVSILELGGIAVDQRITPVPSSERALLGLSAARGQAMAVFDWATMLGEVRPAAMPRWLALSAGVEPVGFAFTQLDGYLRVQSSEIAQVTRTTGALIGGVIRGDEHRPIIQVKTAVAVVRGAEVQDGER